MAISRRRLTERLVRGNVPAEQAAEFNNELVEEVERELEPLATKVEANEAIAQATGPLARAINDLGRVVNDLSSEMRKLRSDTYEEIAKLRVEVADREARMTRVVLTMTGTNIATVTAGVSIILVFN